MYMFNWLFGGKPIQEVLMRDPNATETIIWQHPSTEFNTNSRVNLGLNEVAVFYDMYNGKRVIIKTSQDLKTGNIPLLSELSKKVTGKVSKYQCRVYFVRTSPSINLPWGTPNPLGPYEDKKRKGLFYNIYLNGIYSFRIVDVDKFFQLVDADRTIDFKTFERERVFDDLISYIQQKIDCVITTIGTDYICTKAIILKTSEALAKDLQKDVLDDLGIELVKFKIREVNLPNDKDDPYVKAMATLTEEGAMVAALDIQGLQNYMVTHGVRIGELAATNNGMAGTAAGIGVGAGIGAGIGGQLGNMIQTTFGNLSNTVNVDKPGGIPVSIPPISPNVTGTLSFEKMSKLEGLKELYSQNIITKEQYDSAVADILQSL